MLISSDYSRADLERIVTSETAKAEQRAAQGHTWAAKQHRDNADEAQQRIDNRQYGRKR